MGAAVGWGALAASSLVLGALLGLARRWPRRAVGAVLGFGAGALISAVSFDLFDEGRRIGGPGTVAIGLAAGALTYFVADSVVERRSGGSAGAAAGSALALGCMLATPVGYALADAPGGDLQAIIDGFAAGALLVMLIDSMIPEATSKTGRPAGLVTVLGFAVAAGLSGVS